VVSNISNNIVADEILKNILSNNSISDNVILIIISNFRPKIKIWLQLLIFNFYCQLLHFSNIFLQLFYSFFSRICSVVCVNCL